MEEIYDGSEIDKVGEDALELKCALERLQARVDATKVNAEVGRVLASEMSNPGEVPSGSMSGVPDEFCPDEDRLLALLEFRTLFGIILSDRERDVLIRYFLEGDTLREIARRYDCWPSTIEGVVKKAVRVMRNYIENPRILRPRSFNIDKNAYRISR